MQTCNIAQLMPLPLTVSCFNNIQIGFPFWYGLTWVVSEKGPLNGCVCVCLVLSEETRHSIRVVPVVELAPMAITLLSVDLEMTRKIYTLINIYVCSKVVRNSFDAISKDCDEARVASRSTTS